MTVTVKFDTEELKNWVADLGEDVEKALRPAAQAGAQILYEAARSNVRSTAKAHWFHGTSFKVNGKKYKFEPGTLKNAIYQAYSADNSDKTNQTYHVSWNYKKAPYGFMVEFGTAKGAKPVAFLRRAADLHPKALQAVEAKFFSTLKHFK